MLNKMNKIEIAIALRKIQALLFGDGGIFAFGANCFNDLCIDYILTKLWERTSLPGEFQTMKKVV